MTNGTVSPASTRQILAAQMHRRAQHGHIGPDDGSMPAIFETRDPGHDQAEAETEYKLAAHCNAAALADH
jgi:hypothetical protein